MKRLEHEDFDAVRSLLDQDVITAAVDRHMVQYRSTHTWSVLTSAVAATAAIGGVNSVPIINADLSPYWMSCFSFAVWLFGWWLSLDVCHRLRALLSAVANDRVFHAFASITLHAWSANPLACIGAIVPRVRGSFAPFHEGGPFVYGLQVALSSTLVGAACWLQDLPLVPFLIALGVNFQFFVIISVVADLERRLLFSGTEPGESLTRVYFERAMNRKYHWLGMLLGVAAGVSLSIALAN